MTPTGKSHISTRNLKRSSELQAPAPVPDPDPATAPAPRQAAEGEFRFINFINFPLYLLLL